MKRYLGLALPLALAACAKPPQAGSATAPPATTAAAAPADASTLSADHWRLSDAEDVNGQRIETLFANAQKPLQLDFKEGRVTVGNTCNRMGGAYSVEGDQLKLGRMASTMMACADAKLMALDQAAGKRLEGTARFAVTDNMLVLTTVSGDVLSFAGEPTAETRYGGPGEIVFLEVAAQTKPCSHPLIPDRPCLQVRELEYDDKAGKAGTDGAFGNFHGDIEGYAHEPGIRNVLRVKRYPVKDPPADGSSLAYVLDMVVESEIVKP
jgi:heat shock protein HslJ